MELIDSVTNIPHGSRIMAFQHRFFRGALMENVIKIGDKLSFEP